jgi:hypothetical protein
MAVERGEVAHIKVANVAHVTNVDEAGEINVLHVLQVHVGCLLPWLLHLLGVIHSRGWRMMARKNECRRGGRRWLDSPLRKFARPDLIL